MKTMEFSKAPESVQNFARQAEGDTLVLTRRGKPVFAIVPVDDVDAETIALSTNPRFRAILKKSDERLRKEGGIPFDEACKRFGVSKRALAAAQRRLLKKGYGR